MAKLRNICALAVLDLAFACALALVIVMTCPRLALAYVDPSIMTYTIQALAGVAVALSAVLGVAWRRMSKAIYRRFNIDENAGKVKEGPVRRIDPDSAQGEHARRKADELAATKMALVGSKRPQNQRWSFRFVLSLVASIFLVYTIGVVAPLEMVASSYESLVFGVGNVWMPLVVFALVVALVLAVGISLVRGRAFNVLLAVIVALGLCMYVQGAFMNTGLPVADGTPVNWGEFAPMMFLTGLVWLLVFAVAVFLAWRRGSLLKSCSVIVCVVLIVVQSIGLVTLFANPQSSADGYDVISGKPLVTGDGLMEVDPEKNVVVFVLDTIDNEYMDKIAEDYPDVLAPFTGFTWFRNSTGNMIPSRYAVSSLLTGRTLSHDDPAFSNTLIREWYAQENMLDLIGEQGYEVDVYTTEAVNGLIPLLQKADNVRRIDFQTSIPTAVSQLWKCALYRDMPWILKAPFWFYTGDVNTAISFDAASSDPALTPYMNDDVAYYEGLRREGLRIDSDERREKGSPDEGDKPGRTRKPEERGKFKFIHMDGMHYPITMNENIQRVSEDDTDMYRQGVGSLRIVAEYLDQMKELGVYDQATIIITADHGKWYLSADIDKPSSPILLVKPAETPREAAAPLRVSDVPTGHIDMPATLLEAVGADTSGFGSGKSVFDIPPRPRTRHYDATSVEGDDHVYTFVKEWAITGDVRDFDNWEKTGREWPIVSD